MVKRFYFAAATIMLILIVGCVSKYEKPDPAEALHCAAQKDASKTDTVATSCGEQSK